MVKGAAKTALSFVEVRVAPTPQTAQVAAVAQADSVKVSCAALEVLLPGGARVMLADERHAGLAAHLLRLLQTNSSILKK